MGWWPFSSSESSNDSARPQGDASSSSTPPKRDFSLTDAQRQRIFGVPAAAKSSSAERQTDPELDAFLKEIGAEAAPAQASIAPVSPAPYPAIGGVAPPVVVPSPTRQTQEPTVPRHDESGRRINPDGSLDISPDAMYPRTMSCREAFDQAFYCQSLGGKFNDIYRHGSLKPCSEQWGAFWFCMRIRTYSAKDKEELISDHYKGREERKKKATGSSEDIWDIRTKAVETAFGRDPDEDDDSGLLVKE
jgi:hypothetical protein